MLPLVHVQLVTPKCVDTSKDYFVSVVLVKSTGMTWSDQRLCWHLVLDHKDCCRFTPESNCKKITHEWGHGFLILCLLKLPPEPIHCHKHRQYLFSIGFYRPKNKKQTTNFIHLPTADWISELLSAQSIVPQKWQTTFLEAHEVQITKMLFPYFCLNSIQHFIADKKYYPLGHWIFSYFYSDRPPALWGFHEE